MVHQNIQGLWMTDSPCINKWLVGQAVKTPASHAGNGGSIPPRVTTTPDKPQGLEIYDF